MLADPGNFLVSTAPHSRHKPVLLDFGLCTRLVPSLRCALAKLVVGVSSLGPGGAVPTGVLVQVSPNTLFTCFCVCVQAQSRMQRLEQLCLRRSAKWYALTFHACRAGRDCPSAHWAVRCRAGL